jgi:hypothetical protein
VKDKGVWWKSVDSDVTEVNRIIFALTVTVVILSFFRQVSEEIVLTDTAGIHLGAGPYMLFYSRTLSEEDETMPLPWPQPLKVNS